MLPLLPPNAGTPLMMTTFLHLAFGNAVIGIVEAIVLRFAFRVPLLRGVLWMVAANYLSMSVGLILVCWWPEALPGRDDWIAPGGVLSWLAGALAVLWAITVFVEWPFVHDAIGKTGSWRRAFAASLVAQTLSFATLVPIYLIVAPISVVTQTTAVDAAALAPGLAAHVYYLDEYATAVWSVSLDGSAPTCVADVNGGSRDSRLVASPATGDLRITGSEDVVATVNGRLLPGEAEDSRVASEKSQDGWVVRTGYWANDGLRATHRQTGQDLRLALETPFLTWASRDATLLPGDIVVYALGPHIVALELATLRLAVLARGRSPVVALDAR